MKEVNVRRSGILLAIYSHVSTWQYISVFALKGKTTPLPDELGGEAEVLVEGDEDDPLDARHDELHHADHRVGRPLEDVAERQRGQPHDHRVRHGAAAHGPVLDKDNDVGRSMSLRRALAN